MSQENIEIVKRAFDGFASGELDATLACLTADYVLYPFPEWPDESEYRGHEGYRRALGLWTENFDDFNMEVSELRDLGHRVLILGELAGRIKGSGVPIRQPIGAVYFDFRNGRVGATRFVLTWKQTLEAVAPGE
jgi:ketosteroid isomerase-like protein